jgi:hypothetical protein
VAAAEQGPGAAQKTAEDTIADLRPHWLALVGIAGAVPDQEFHPAAAPISFPGLRLGSLVTTQIESVFVSLKLTCLIIQVQFDRLSQLF